jgi:hypothetical protein
MRLNKYLINEYQTKKHDSSGRGTPIKLSTTIELIKKNAIKSFNSAVDKKTIILRVVNVKKKSPYYFVDSKKYETRMSLNTLNYYTLIINNDPSWKKFPKRNIIAKTRDDFYRLRYLILPYDNVKIGVCSDRDIWFSFKNIPVTSMNEFNSFIMDLLGGQFDSNIDQFKKACKKFDNEKYTLKIEDDYSLYEWFWKTYDGDLYKNIVHWLDPNKNKFKLVKSGDFIKTWKEVWFDGPAIWISLKNLRDFSKIVKSMRGKALQIF